jgi:transposase
MSGLGKAITTQEKEIVVNVKHHFDIAKKESPKDRALLKSAVALTATATKLSEISVARIMAEYNKNKSFAPPVPKGSRPYAIDGNIKTICREIIRTHNINRDHLSLRSLIGILSEKHELSVARETLRLNLLRWGIVYGSVSRHTALREKDYVVNARRDYLIQKKKLNESGKTFVYLDETYINKNHSGSDFSWYCEDWEDDPLLDKSYGPYINKPSGKGERLIIINAVTKNGWVKNAKLAFQAKSNTGDYHGSMDEDNFTRWFTEQLLPNIPDESVIVMDNASYHNMYLDDGVPSLNSKKFLMQEWLDSNDILYDKDHLRPKLIELINKHRSPKVFKLDHMLKNDPRFKSRNITILRTPQYHPELQPIEKCWAVLKQHMAMHCDFTMKGLKENLENSWLKVTKKTMNGIMKKISYWEEYHYIQDGLLDDSDDEDEYVVISD